jgi:tRNA 2-selenouridine synthase
MFESRVWKALGEYSTSRPVYVESESRRIGALRVPKALIDRMWAAECIVLEAPLAARVELLEREYAHFFEHTDELNAKLDCLLSLHGHAVLEHWKSLARSADWDRLVAELLERHYDPAYTRAIGHHYPALDRAQRLTLPDAGDAAFDALARRCIEGEARAARAQA